MQICNGMLGLLVLGVGCVVALGVERDGRASENIEQDFDEDDSGNLDGRLIEEFKKVNEDNIYNSKIKCPSRYFHELILYGFAIN